MNAPLGNGQSENTGGPPIIERESVDVLGPWPTAAAVVTGPVVHGAGHLVAGEKRTGLRLLLAEGMGLATAAAGIAGLAVSGASEKTVLPFIAATGLGAGLFLASFLADIYGVIAPPEGFGQPILRPALVAEAGIVMVDDPLFPYDAFSYLGGQAFFGQHSVALQAHLGMDHSNQRVRAFYGYRFRESDASTYLEAKLGAVYHRFAPEGFAMGFAEGTVGGRMGLQRIGRTLQGAFVEGGLGLAFGAHRYFGLATEPDSLLLMRMGFGFFVGNGGSCVVYYDHRHDDYAAGMKLPGLASGVVGHIGAALQHYVTPVLGVALRAETGSARLVGISLLYRRKRW